MTPRPADIPAQAPLAVPTRPNVKRRPILFAVLCTIFALWIALLLFLYFKTVYPLRHGSSPAEQTIGK